MKSQDMSKSIRAFATLLEGPRADGMLVFANVFDGGKPEESVAARVKRIVAVFKRAGTLPGAPTGLKRDVVALGAGLAAAGAKAQAKDYQTLLALFEGSENSVVSMFVAGLADARDAPPAKAREEIPPNQEQARQFTDELVAAVLDAEAFSRIASRLEDSKLVSTPTLSLIANRFLGNAKLYKSRKPAISDIMRRHKDDLRSHARGKALDRIGV